MYKSMAHRLLLRYFGSRNIGSIRKTDVKAWMTWAESQAYAQEHFFESESDD
jgi:hypothetical protein